MPNLVSLILLTYEKIAFLSLFDYNSSPERVKNNSYVFGGLLNVIEISQ